MAHHTVVENSKRHKSRSGFPKTLECERWGECFITTPLHPALPPLPLCHFIFLLSARTSRFIFSHAFAANPKLDLRDGAEEGSWKPKKATTGASRDNEWVTSNMGEADINRMVEVGVLSDRVIAEWWPASGEPFLMPHTDKVVVLRIISGVG